MMKLASISRVFFPDCALLLLALVLIGCSERDHSGGTPEPPDTTVCDEPATAISAVQGGGATTSLSMQAVEVAGIVTGVFQGEGSLRGLFVQEEPDDTDADPLTSEGLFAFTDLAANVGDRVRIQGTAIEYEGLTELNPVTGLTVCSNGNDLPAAVELDLPIDADVLERHENMRVRLPDGVVVNDLHNLWRFGEFTVSGKRRFQPTQVAAPGAPAHAVAASNAMDALVVDDGRTPQHLAISHVGEDDIHPFSSVNPIRNGMTVDGLAGILHFAFNSYRLQVTESPVINEMANPRTDAPADVGGTLKAGSMNVFNYFSTLTSAGPVCGPLANQECRGANSIGELDRQTAKIVAALIAMNADLLGLIEVENNASESLEALVGALNTATAPGTWAYIDTGAIGSDVIRQALVYRPAAVTPVGEFAVLTSEVDARFNDELNRPSLAQSFRANDNDALFTVVVNHLKSKGSDCNSVGDPDTGDGQGNCNLTRNNAAAALADWANGDPTGTGSGNVLLLGDLNSHAMEDPITTLASKGFTNLVAQFKGAPTSSYVFQGQAGTLDYALGNAALAPQVTGATIWHVNSDEAVVLDYNEELNKPAEYLDVGPAQSSDHDPIFVGLDLDP